MLVTVRSTGEKVSLSLCVGTVRRLDFIPNIRVMIRRSYSTELQYQRDVHLTEVPGTSGTVIAPLLGTEAL